MLKGLFNRHSRPWLSGPSVHLYLQQILIFTIYYFYIVSANSYFVSLFSDFHYISTYSNSFMFYTDKRCAFASSFIGKAR